MINNFKEDRYLVNKDIKNLKEYLKKEELEEIRQGLRKFHPEFEPYNEEKYINNNPDIKETIKKGAIKDGFEHFCKFGYKEIVEKKRKWNKVKEIKEEKKILINNFQEDKYLEANPDIKEAIKNKQLKSALEHLEKYGLEEIRQGLRKFHPEFEPYNEEKYINNNPDIKETIKKGAIKDGFEHFCKFGYKEIINNKRLWDKSIVKEDNIYLIFGIPRSGLTLCTYLMSFKNNYTTWFLPFSTRKNFGIPYFDNIETIKNEYKKVFPNKKLTNKFVLSESTANLEVFEWLKNGILQSDINYSIIWMFRNINESFLSLKEAASKYWEDKEDNINFENYKQYINFVKKSFFNAFKLFSKKSEKVHCFSLSNIVNSDLKKIYKLKIEDFKLNIDKFEIAGDPSFLEKNIIDTKVVFKRSEEWDKYTYLYDKLEEKEKKFVDFYNELVLFIENDPNITLKELTDIYSLKYFDKEYYLNTYEDIKKAGIDPFEHYIQYGYKEKRKPAKNIDYVNTEYIERIHPLIYYIFIDQFQEEKFNKINDKGIYGKLELKLIDPEKYEINEKFKLKAPYFKKPKVSIIIPAYNQSNYTLACIESIIKNTPDVSYEIIIMDDNSPDPKAKEIEKYLENIIFISNGINYGFLENCNKGAKIAKGEYILFLNNDTNVQPEWLSLLLKLIESDEKIGMVGSRLVYPTGQQQEAGGIVWKDASAWNFGRLDDPKKPEYNYVKECDYISGAAIMIKKDLWEEIGGFDLRYKPAYFEDTDLAFEVRKHGYKVMLQPKSIVVHFEGISHGTDISQGIKSYQLKNREKFIEKWKDILEKENFPNGTNVFYARDRSRNKPHILYVDHYIPHYDQDAGSKATFQYLKILAKNDMQIHFVGDNFYHYPETPHYLDALQQLGIEVLYGNWYANHFHNWFKENGQYFDYVILSRPHIARKYIETIRNYTNAKIIYMGHDLHFLREHREYEIKGDPSYLKSSKKWQEIEMNLINHSDVSYFFSNVEKEEIQKINPQASVDVVPLYIYDEFKKPTTPMEQRKDIMFVGGFAHSPNIDAMLWFVKEIWPNIIKQIPNIKLYIIGSKVPNEIKSLANENIIVTGYVSDEKLDEYYQNCKIVVAPLRYGAGIKGKIVDALYNGMPLVTTSIGAEGLLEAESVMCIADEPDKFAQCVISLYNDNKLAETYSQKALAYCQKYFSIEMAKQKMSHIFTQFKEEK